jgi:aspartate/methionine/tyrosine aminotransferase
MVDIVCRRSNTAYNQLRNAGVTIRRPGGTIYAFPHAPNGHSGEELAELCLSKGLGIIPGSAFGAPNNVRITVDKYPQVLDRGLHILIRAMHELEDK